MRQVTEQRKRAGEQGKPKTCGNTETHGQTVLRHRKAIIKRDGWGVVEWTLAGWNTPTTRERINGILGVGVHQVNFEPVLNGEVIDSSDWQVCNQKLPDPLVS